MSAPFDIAQAMDDLYDVNALALVCMATHERGDDAWRVLDMLSERLIAVINQLDALESGRSGPMNPPFGIPQAIGDLYGSNALATAAKATHERGDDAWRVLDMLSERLIAVINQLDALVVLSERLIAVINQPDALESGKPEADSGARADVCTPAGL